MKNISALLIATLLLACASGTRGRGPAQSKPTNAKSGLRVVDPNGDIFKDHFNSASKRYSNTDTGLAIHFPPDWTVFPHYNQFPSALQAAATKMRLSDRESGINGEIVLLARSSDRLLWFRIITEESNLSLSGYHSIIRAVNDDVLILDETKEMTVLPNGQQSIIWKYSVPKGSQTYRFHEYQIRHNRFNTRLTFWTVASLMPVVESRIDALLSKITSQALQSI